MKIIKPNQQVAGVYKITNTLNGKIYIGSSKDLYHRKRQYEWGCSSDKEYSETRRTVSVEMRKYGIDNFNFDIIAMGKEYEDCQYRLSQETAFIKELNATNPEIGYNKARKAVRGLASSRKQGAVERNLRTDPIYSVDLKAKSIMIYLSGAKGVGADTGHDRTVATHALRNGLLFDKHLYLFYVDEDRRKKTHKKIVNKFDADDSKLKQYLKAYLSDTDLHLETISSPNIVLGLGASGHGFHHAPTHFRDGRYTRFQARYYSLSIYHGGIFS